jgi:hypothetical protein
VIFCDDARETCPMFPGYTNFRTADERRLLFGARKTSASPFPRRAG